ncbi:MAG: hypothetical protein KBD53_04205 [Candidatus Omnitrophica bacterium]|nr:hypothetical protein [Candidatus Omnitrophota bacterium]
MKKLFLSLVAVLAGLSLTVAPVYAQVQFFVDAELPASNGATFAVSQVDPGPPEVFTLQAPGFDALDFGLLTLDVDNGIFLPDYYWAIDVGANGAGSPDLAFAYTDTANPNGGLNNGTGLGGRGTIAYMEVLTGSGGAQTVNLIRGEALQQSNTSGGIDETDYDGFLRFAVGIATGDPLLQEGNAVPFTASDNPGTYSGTLTVTATFD